MTSFPSLKCPVCSKKYVEVPAFAAHVRAEHPGTVPEGWSDLRYSYFVYTGRARGRCRECGGETPWNETTGAYAKICTSPACKKKYRERFMASMRARHGKDNLLDDPKYRERMLTGRKISGTYRFQDGGEVAYMGKLEKAFLEMLDKFFGFPSSDILSPSPNRYIYHYSNPNDEAHEGEHTYVPDFYIPSCNLEIELKSAKNERPRNLMIDVPRDACKDLHMIENPTVNYVKVYEDDYHVFFQVFADLAMQNQTGNKKPIKYISRSLLTSVYRDYIPDDKLKILDEFIYKYSDKTVLKKRAKATEADVPILETPEEELDEPESVAPGDPTLIDIDAFYADEMNIDEDEPDIIKETDSTGVSILPIIDDLPCAPDAEHATMEWFACESIFGLGSKDVDTSKIDGRTAVKYSRWRDKLFGGNLLGTAAAKNYVKVAIKNGILEIRGINCNLLLYRIKETYAESKLKYIFQYAYNAKSLRLYEKRRISRGDMKIDYVYAPEFFCIELIDLFSELGKIYHDMSYRRISEMIYEISWLSKADKIEMPPMSTAPLKNLALELMPHQVTFIEKWPQLKAQLNLNGYVLSFKPGKGKTLTAIGLAECLHTQRVYIVCPNNLKDNWALEIKKYYTKYSDEELWRRDVCILGGKFGDPKTARFIIVNNESLKLMQPVAKHDPDAMLILDECHNFRSYGGTRTKELFALADKIGSKNVLCVSATPIKAAPSEITPVLYLIDPTFNDEAAAMYDKCFSLSTTAAMSLINKRFGMIIYRPADVNVDLPSKNLHALPLSVSNEEKFYLNNVHDEIIAEFKKRHDEWLKTVQPIIDDFRSSIFKWALCERRYANGYLQWVIYSSNSLRGEGEFHELDVKDYKVFIETNIRPNTQCPASEVERLLSIERELITAAKRHMGYSIGDILPPRRNELYIRLYEENREMFYEMIRNRGKKTVIFSTMVPVIKDIVKDLTAFGIGTVSITGETKNRLEVLNQFREDPNTLVLVATSWCMGVGVTLTEASQMFFFGTPWRSTDFEQACDRIWRIGQTETVDIYTVMCKSKMKNLSDRMQDILDWSNKMFDTAITAAEIGDDVPNETEKNLLAAENFIDLDEELAMEALFRSTGQMLGGAQYNVQEHHVLCVLCNCSRDKFFEHCFSFPPVAKFFKGFKTTSVVTINECIDIFNSATAINKVMIAYSGTNLGFFYGKFHEKCQTYDAKLYAGKRIMAELIKETIEIYTAKFPEDLLILFLETAYNYPSFMEYPVLRLAVGQVQNFIWNVEEAIAEMQKKGKEFNMSDPSLRGKGTKVSPKTLELFHVSPHKFDTLKPQPTKTPLFGENVVIERASAGPNVDACFHAVGLKNFTVYYVYKLELTPKTRIMKPNVKTVPDAMQTGEHWVLDPVKVKVVDTKFVCADYMSQSKRQLRYTSAETTTVNPKNPSELLKIVIENKLPVETGKPIFNLFIRSGEKIGFAEMDFNTLTVVNVEIAEKYRHKGYATTLLSFIAKRSQRKFTCQQPVSPNDLGRTYIANIILKLFPPAIPRPATESEIVPVMETEIAWRRMGTLLKTMQQILSTCKYGMLVNGKIEDPDDDYYEQYYRTVSPGAFLKQRCGTCYEFATYQDFFLKAHNIFCQNYFIELTVPPFMTHMFTVIERDDRFIYPETAFQMIAGVYQAYTLDEIISYILVNMAKADGKARPYNRDEFKVYRVKPNYSIFNESLQDVLERVRKTGKELQIRYDPKKYYLEPFSLDDPEPASETNFNFAVDSHQYEELTPGMVTVATWVYVLTEPLIHTWNGISSMMTKPLRYTRAMLRSRQLLEEMCDKGIAAYILAVRMRDNRNPQDYELFHTTVVIPFNDGALIPEFGLPLDQNGLYFAESLPTAILGIAQKMGQAKYGNDFTLKPGEFEVSGKIVFNSLIAQMGGENVNADDWFEKVWLQPQDISMEHANYNHTELHKVEVLKHGWIAKRY